MISHITQHRLEARHLFLHAGRVGGDRIKAVYHLDEGAMLLCLAAQKSCVPLDDLVVRSAPAEIV